MSHLIISTDKQSNFLSFMLFIVITFLLLGHNLFDRKVLFVTFITLLYFNRYQIPTLLQSLRNNISLMVVLSWCLISYQWSIWQQKSLEEALIQWMMFLTCILIANTFSLTSIIRICKKAAILVIIVNILFVIISPSGAFSAAGRVGIYNHKNAFGLIISMCIFFLIFSEEEERRSKVDIIFICIAFVLLTLSFSKTSIGLLVFSSLCVYITTHIPKPFMIRFFRYLPYVGWSILLLAFITLIIFRFDVLNYLYYNMDDELMTGRGKLWLTMLLHAEDNLVAGFGFNSVWGKQDYSEIYFTELFLYNPLWVEELAAADGGYIDLIISIFYLFIQYVYKYS